jgi:hypothetical protein
LLWFKIDNQYTRNIHLEKISNINFMDKKIFLAVAILPTLAK